MAEDQHKKKVDELTTADRDTGGMVAGTVAGTVAGAVVGAALFGPIGFAAGSAIGAVAGAVGGTVFAFRPPQGARNQGREPYAYQTLSSIPFTINRNGGTFGSSSEFGCKLEIPKNSLPPDVEQLDVTIQPHISSSPHRGGGGSRREQEGRALALSVGESVGANLPLPPVGKLPLPEGTELVSGVYEMKSTDVTLKKDVSITFDHCVDVPDESEGHASLRVVRAHGEGGFKLMDDAKVEVRGSSVVLKMTRLVTSFYAVVATVAARRFVGYCGIMYRLQKESNMVTSVNFHFIVVKDLNVCIKSIEARYERCQQAPCRNSPDSVQCHHNFRPATKVFEPAFIHFTPEGSEGGKLTMDVGQEGISSDGWMIRSKTLPAEIQENDAYHFLPTNEHHPLCELVASWEYTSVDPGPLSEYIPLLGTTSPQALLIEHTPVAPGQPRGYLRDVPTANQGQVPTLQDIRFEGHKKRMYIPHEIGSKYREFGTVLLEDGNGAKVWEIERECHSYPYWINYKIYNRWIRGEGRKPVSWATLAQVLRIIGKSALADDIEAKLAESATPPEKDKGRTEGEVRMKSHTDVSRNLCSAASAHSLGGKEMDKDQVEGRKHTVRPRGVEYLSNAMVRVRGSKHDQVVLWEERGFRMYIPSGALDESEEREIALSTSHSGCFDFPAGTFPVSFVYYVEPSGPFRKPVTLEIEHCCSHGLDQLEFAFAESSSKNPPYRFVRHHRGKFPMHSSYGQLEVSHFSLYAITSPVVPLSHQCLAQPTTQSPLWAEIREIHAQPFLQPPTQSPLRGDVQNHVSHQPTAESPLEAHVNENRAQPSHQPTTKHPLDADVDIQPSHQPTTKHPLDADVDIQPSHQPTTKHPLDADVDIQPSHQPTTKHPLDADVDTQPSLQPATQSPLEAAGCQYRLHLFHRQRSKKTWHVVLVVTERLAECSQVVRRKYNNWRETMEEKALHFKAESQKLSIDISDDGVTISDGVWKIFPLAIPPEIRRSVIHGMTYKDGGYTPANCEMKIQLQREDCPQSPILYLLVLNGLQWPTKMWISIDPEEYSQGDRHDRGSRNELTADTECITPACHKVLSKKHLPKLTNILSKGAFRWYSIGIQLHIDSGYLEALGQEALRSIDLFCKMLIRWLNTARPYPTVGSLVAALESPTVGELRLAEDVRRAFL